VSRAVLLVIDGLGIGAMPDANRLRAADSGANTLLHVHREAARSGHPLDLPNLSGLGLDVTGIPGRRPQQRIAGAAAGRCALGYPGADTNIAHQTIFGSDMRNLRLAPFSTLRADITDALEANAHTVKVLSESVLMIDGTMIAGDNLEADPGLNYNITGSLDTTSFDRILEVARVVREVSPVSRIIAVGGTGLELDELVGCVRSTADGVAGIDTPQTGFYLRPGLRVIHLTRPVDTARQVPSLCAGAGMPVTLIGKMADVVECAAAARIPAVVTGEVLDLMVEALEVQARGLIAVNVQETDLAGHQQDPTRYAALLNQIDVGLGRLLGGLAADDTLIVTGDHGNDPTIGHAFHTREWVPVLMYSKGSPLPFRTFPERHTLADVGATLAVSLGLDPTKLEQGEPIGLP
jgi:phosphopentomutase